MNTSLRVWRFRLALWRIQRALPAAWKALSEEEQADEIRRLVADVRRERRIRYQNTASVTETEVHMDIAKG